MNTQATRAGLDLTQLTGRAREDEAFARVHARFEKAGIQHWLQEEEKLLLFALAAYAPGEGIIVEIGSFEGGSAAFFAAGLARRGTGHLYCVDPHLGGPPWLGMAPAQRTLSAFRETLRACGVEDRVSAKIGESTAVAAVWPAEPIDALLIDGDHSFRGALRDFECWVPKLKPGGLVIIDDADDAVLAELAEFVEFVKGLETIRHIETIRGMAVFTKTADHSWETLEEIGRACRESGLARPWDFEPVHEQALPENYRRSGPLKGGNGLETAYQLCFLARCGAGFYGYSPSTRSEDREFLHSLSADRRDGDVLALTRGAARGRRFRAVLCCPYEASELAPLLMPGGVLIAREENLDSASTRLILLRAGLEGCGYGDQIHWGVWKPGDLSPEAVVEYAARACRP
ncbi:MAG TPA: class I SAM-dependent methyltransferase [Bryobacteraceae bacterium]|jgi:predicted O-methyltransferase YrrM|nr:class I SAM-dependent methyltransferase [Bryobacteraceae bacterium]